MPGSRPRPLGRPRLTPIGANVPAGWQGYRVARDLGVEKIPPHRHGNWRHGQRSAATIAERRHFRKVKAWMFGGWRFGRSPFGPEEPGWRGFALWTG